MILDDFESPGVHFLMIFEYFGCQGFILSPRLGFLWFWRPFRAKGVVLFGSIFDTFWMQCLMHFLVPFWKTLFAKYGARSIQNGRHLEVILMTFWGTGYFLIFATSIIRNLICWGREGTQIASFLVTLEGALREASGKWFFVILSDFGLPGGDQLAPKKHQKMRPKKVLKNGTAT